MERIRAYHEDGSDVCLETARPILTHRPNPHPSQAGLLQPLTSPLSECLNHDLRKFRAHSTSIIDSAQCTITSIQTTACSIPPLRASTSQFETVFCSTYDYPLSLPPVRSFAFRNSSLPCTSNTSSPTRRTMFCSHSYIDRKGRAMRRIPFLRMRVRGAIGLWVWRFQWLLGVRVGRVVNTTRPVVPPIDTSVGNNASASGGTE
jgi:hypothetical protein